MVAPMTPWHPTSLGALIKDLPLPQADGISQPEHGNEHLLHHRCGGRDNSSRRFFWPARIGLPTTIPSSSRASATILRGAFSSAPTQDGRKHEPMSVSREESASLQPSGTGSQSAEPAAPEKTLVRCVLLDVRSFALFREVGMMFMLYRFLFQHFGIVPPTLLPAISWRNRRHAARHDEIQFL